MNTDTYQLHDRELATVLAALRRWQGDMPGSLRPDSASLSDIASNGGRHTPLTAGEIDGLCERLNISALKASDEPITVLKLSGRSRKCLYKLGINTIADLVRHAADELMDQRNFGLTSLREVRKRLADRGLTLRGEEI